MTSTLLYAALTVAFLLFGLVYLIAAVHRRRSPCVITQVTGAGGVNTAHLVRIRRDIDQSSVKTAYALLIAGVSFLALFAIVVLIVAPAWENAAFLGAMLALAGWADGIIRSPVELRFSGGRVACRVFARWHDLNAYQWSKERRSLDVFAERDSAGGQRVIHFSTEQITCEQKDILDRLLAEATMTKKVSGTNGTFLSVSSGEKKG